MTTNGGVFMKSIDKYQSWIPSPNVTGKVIVERLEDTDDGLSIHLRMLDNDSQSIVLFDSYISYRNMDESYRTKTFSEVGGFDASLYIVKNSSWIKWLHEESLGFYTDREITHYSIITAADCIDVLSEFEPEILQK